MAAIAGTIARETGYFRCAKCHEQVHVTQGKKIPPCPRCGGDTFDARFPKNDKPA